MAKWPAGGQNIVLCSEIFNHTGIRFSINDVIGSLEPDAGLSFDDVIGSLEPDATGLEVIGSSSSTASGLIDNERTRR